MRKGDENRRTWYRAERVFREGDYWYISTREGIPVGSYNAEGEARQEAARLAQILQTTKSDIDAIVVIREFRDRPRR